MEHLGPLPFAQIEREDQSHEGVGPVALAPLPYRELRPTVTVQFARVGREWRRLTLPPPNPSQRALDEPLPRMSALKPPPFLVSLVRQFASKTYKGQRVNLIRS
jgi:hypothetical protein